ncbi:MAG: hypothetical protein H7175_18180 [Burkholderiales bacterium]|nr:hypothetical protein [Anaerolineae bacterium]
MEIVQCASCDGYGWITDEFEGTTDDCDWCGGTGYVYRDENGVDHHIPDSDYGKVSDTLENLETKRMHNLGYKGEAIHPKKQAIRLRKDDNSKT